MKRLIAFFLLTLLTISPISNSLGKANSDHIIAGYGPVYGELFSPKSMQIFENKLLVIDEFGVSSFDLTTKQFIKRFPVDLGREDPNTGMEVTESMMESQTWVDWLKIPYRTNFLRRIVPMGSGNVFSAPFYSRSHKIDLNIDSKGLIYLLGMKGIQVYDPESGSLRKTIKVPVIELINDSLSEMNSFVMKVYQDKIYVLQSFLVKTEDRNKSSIQVFSLEGQLEKVISIQYETDKALIGPYDFTYLPDLKLFAFWNYLFPRFCTAREGLNPVFLCDENGQEVKVAWNNDHSTARILEFQPPNQLVLSGLVTTKYKMNTEGRVEFTFESEVELNDSDYTFLSDIDTSEDSLGVISNNFDEGLWEYKVLYIQDQKEYRFGSCPNKKGQVFGSTAFAADKEGNLYLANKLNQDVDCFSKNGEITRIRNTGRYDYDDYFREFVMDDNQNLYGMTTDVSGYCIEKYNIPKNSRESFDINFDAEEDGNNPYAWYSMEISENNFFVLDSGKIENNGPSLFRLKPKKTTYNTSYDPLPIELSNPTPIDQSYPPFFIGFHLTDNEYLFLDSQHQEIWIYSRTFEKLKEVIKLPKSKSSFYSSFDLYPDGTYLVTDAIQNKFLHLSKKGEVLETFGESGAVAIGTTKEAYLEKPNQFNGLFRAKIANGYIYANDLFNYRFHIFPLPQRPTVDWLEKDTNVEKISIFENKEVTFYFSEPTHQNVPFQVSSTIPWIQILNPNGMTGDGVVKVTILGVKLLPWNFNAGKIQVTFPDYPELNTELRILVEYVYGNILTLTIGSSQATLNGQAITLDSASIPLLKKGRTFVGIRLMGEMVFSNTAKISFDAKTQTVYFEIGQKKIELTINQPYALVNGTKVPLDAPPFIQAGRTFVPLRFISENLDASVDYDSKAQSITITYPKKK